MRSIERDIGRYRHLWSALDHVRVECEKLGQLLGDRALVGTSVSAYLALFAAHDYLFAIPANPLEACEAMESLRQSIGAIRLL